MLAFSLFPYLVRGRIGWLVEVNDSGTHVVGDWALQWGASSTDWCVFVAAHVELIVVLHIQGCDHRDIKIKLRSSSRCHARN
jgi:hypothetical protein